MPAGSQQLLAQVQVPAQRCDTEGRTGHKGRGGENGDGNRDGTGTGTSTWTGKNTRAGVGVRRGAGMGTRIEIKGWGGERAWNLRSGNRGGSEDARRGATPTSNQQLQPQNPMPQRDRRIISRTRGQGKKARDRIGEGGGEGEKAQQIPEEL